MRRIDALISHIREMDNPSAVGLDLRLDLIPDEIKKEAFERLGCGCEAVSEIFYYLNGKIIDAVCGIVPAVKPQIAFYEMYGAPGIEAYVKTVAYAAKKGMTVIGDVKRSDVASTAEAYSNGHIGWVSINGESLSVFGEDFITINPYLGGDSVAPFLINCEKYGTGLFILVKTSNPGSGQIQDLMTTDGCVHEIVGRLVSEWGAGLTGEYGYSSIGAVVGATHPKTAATLRGQMRYTFFLAPGYGAQGGGAKDAAACFDSSGGGAIVNSSRAIIGAWMESGVDFDIAARNAAVKMRDDIRSALKNA